MKKFLISASLFLCLLGTNVQAETIIDESTKYDSDIVKSGYEITNNGTITKDVIFFGNVLKNNGNIGGDFIVFGSSCFANGTIGGNLRGASGDITVLGKVFKNVSIAAGKINFSSESVVEGSVYCAAGNIYAEGEIKGRAFFFGNNVYLKGKFASDVTVWAGNGQEIGLIIGENTQINGKLTYYGIENIPFPPSANIGDYAFIKQKNKAPKSPLYDFNGILKYAFTSLFMFLVALLTLKLLPSIFPLKGYVIRKEFLKTAGIGAITMASSLLALLSFFILIILGFFVLDFWIALTIGSGFFSFYSIILMLCEIPVGLWLGQLILRKAKGNIAPFALGYFLLRILFLSLYLLSSILTIKLPVHILSTVLHLVVLLLGVGAEVVMIKKILKSANIQIEEAK
jgi:hypothetical protein